MRAPLLVLLLPLAAACVSERRSAPADIAGAVVHAASPARAWRIVEGDVELGSLVRFEMPAKEARFLYAVRNVHGQDLGLVDALGRAFRHVPHERLPRWLGSGTVAQGVARILGSEDLPELVPVALGVLREAELEAPRTVPRPPAPTYSVPRS